jgi:hypothetical protein
MERSYILIIMLWIIMILSFTCVAYADGSINLNYNGKNYVLQKDSLITSNGEYYFDADKMAEVLGLKLVFDSQHKTLTVHNGESADTYYIAPLDYSIVSLKSKRPNTPELINNSIYFPVSFIEEKFNVIAKYDKKSNSVYFLPDKNLKSFTNMKHSYTLTIPDYVNFDLSGSCDSFSEDSIVLSDKNQEFTYSINCDKLDSLSIAGMRMILNDYDSTDEQIFDQINIYTKSYFRAMQALYKSEFFFSGTDTLLSESNIKIFADTNESIYGQPSDLVVYNTVKTDRYSSLEETHIMITVPIYSKLSIYTFNIYGKKGFLREENINRILGLINALKIEGLPNTTNTLKTLVDNKNVSAANLGIYPPLAKTSSFYTEYTNSGLNYSIRYPSVFLPYLQNQIIDSLDYTSFKMDYNNYFSISVENTQNPATAIKEKTDLLKKSLNKRITVKEEGNVILSGKEFYCLSYETYNGPDPYHVLSYYTVNGSKLYTIELNSRFRKPTTEINNAFLEVVKSIRFTEPTKAGQPLNINFKKYLNDYEGYSFSYPENWNLSDISKDINFERLFMQIPEYSGAVEICVNESECLIDASPEELLEMFVSGKANDFKKYAKNYYAPYGARASKVLSISSRIENNAVYAYRLINYLDESDRHKIGYCVDIIRSNKVYTLFISISDYLSTDGYLLDRNLDYIINQIAQSFTLEESGKLLIQAESGSQKGRKLAFLEHSFKLVMGKSTTIPYARYLDTDGDMLLYISNCNEAGAYKLKFNYDKKNLEITSTLAQEDAIYNAKSKLLNMYSDKVIHSITPDPDNMTLTIEYSNTVFSPISKKTYFIDVLPYKSGFYIHLVRKYTVDQLKNEIQSHLENYLMTKVDIQLSDSNNYSDNILLTEKHEIHFISLFAEYNNRSGYFVLRIDPYADNISITKFISFDEVEEKLKDYYNSPFSDLSFVDYTIDDKNKFGLKVHLFSKSASTDIVHNLTVEFDEKTYEIIFGS